MQPYRFLGFYLLFSWCALSAQPAKDQQFGAFAYLGLNLAQIDGDAYTGYNQPGLRGGLGVNLLWSPKLYTSIGFGYSQLGSRASRAEKLEQSGAAINLRLHTIEVPLLFHLRLGDRKATTKKTNYALYRSAELQLGVAVNRTTGRRVRSTGNLALLSARENFVTVIDQYQDVDVQLLVGAAAQLSPAAGLFVQYGLSLQGIYQPEIIRPDEVLSLQPYYLTVGARWTVY